MKREVASPGFGARSGKQVNGCLHAATVNIIIVAFRLL